MWQYVRCMHCNPQYIVGKLFLNFFLLYMIYDECFTHLYCTTILRKKNGGATIKNAPLGPKV